MWVKTHKIFIHMGVDNYKIYVDNFYENAVFIETF